MTSLGELASIVRSKNAGPFQITIDLLFATDADYRRVLASGRLTADEVAGRYLLDPADVSIVAFDRVRAIKVTIPRRLGARGSGSPGDRDVYGAQQHGPLVDLAIP